MVSVFYKVIVWLRIELRSQTLLNGINCEKGKNSKKKKIHHQQIHTVEQEYTEGTAMPSNVK